MRIWQWSFLEVLTLLLLTTSTKIHCTDEIPDFEQTDDNEPQPPPFPDLNSTQTIHTSENYKENRESNQLPNYTHQKRKQALSNNNSSHQTHLQVFIFYNDSVVTPARSLAGNLNRKARDGDLEVEQRLPPGLVQFDKDAFNDQFEILGSGLETREIEEAAEYGLKKMNELINVKEPELYTKGLWLKPDSAAGRVSAFSAPGLKAQRLARFGYAAVQASAKILQQWLGGAELRAGPLLRLPTELRGSLRGTTLQRECRVLTAPTPCRPAARRYRTADGSCNNLQRPRLGGTLTPLQRFLAPRYVDGVQGVRGGLPSPRLVSTRIHRPLHTESPSITLMLMQWGQLIDHDITSTPSSRAFNGSTPRCCGDGGRSLLPEHLLHPECLPITVPSDDPVLSRFNIRCMEFVRSAPVPREDCDFGHRQQMNQVTSYIDASTIYGSSTSQSDSIRLFRGGLIRFGTPDPPNGGEPCRMGAVSAQCLRPGDGRASEQPALTALHIIWVRLHNQIASGFDGLNPHWSDEKLYQETRRLISAIIQHITYREFLPIVLGHEVLRLFDLELLHKGFYLGYDQRVNPSPANSFSAAAYRFGHSLVQDSFVRSDKFHRPIFNNVSLHDEQTNTDNIWSPGSVDRLILGLVNQPSQKRDEFISAELTNHLFQAPGSGSNGFGLDLAAINIQRGRDHGLPTYTSWRQPCGLSPVRNWTDLQRVTSTETAERFRSIFLSVDDIDLYSAGLAEKPVRGGLVGPTFACIIAQQFSNLRRGDRFWYENGNFESSFSSSQLQQIRKLTFAQIICQTMPEIETIQAFVFLTPDNLQNRRELCSNFDFDMTPWTESEAQTNAFFQTNNNAVEFKQLPNNVSNIKEKNAKQDSQDDILSFSLSSLKVATNQRPNTEDILKQTIFRRDKRQTNTASLTNINILTETGTLTRTDTLNKTDTPTKTDTQQTICRRDKRQTNAANLNNTNILTETGTLTRTDTLSRTDTQQTIFRRGKRRTNAANLTNTNILTETGTLTRTDTLNKTDTPTKTDIQQTICRRDKRQTNAANLTSTNILTGTDTLTKTDTLSKTDTPTKTDTMSKTDKPTKTDGQTKADTMSRADTLTKTDALTKTGILTKTDTLTETDSQTRTDDNLEHRELLNYDNLTLSLDHNLTESTRNERKRKRPTRIKTKSKPSTQKPSAMTTFSGRYKKKHRSTPDPKQYDLNFYSDSGTHYTTSYSPNLNAFGTKRPPTNDLTYLVNTVRKTSTTTSTTTKPDYQFHIQINYFYNTTTEKYTRPTKPTNIRRPVYNYDQIGQNTNYNQQIGQNTNYNQPTGQNTNYNQQTGHNTNYNQQTGQNFNYNQLGQNYNQQIRPNSNYNPQIPSYLYNYDSRTSTTRSYSYDYQTTPYSVPEYNYYSTSFNDKIDYGQYNRQPTKKSTVSANPITVIEINSQTLQRPETNKPNIYIVSNLDDQPSKPTYEYKPYRPSSSQDSIHKKPFIGHVNKLDTKPLTVYNQPGYFDHKQYGTEVLYDTEYLANKRRPFHSPPTYGDVNDKLDFDKHTFVKITALNNHERPIITSPRPYDDDKRYVRISTVKGHTTKTDSFNPVYINVQNKESVDDLEMTYDDILEVYMKSDGETANVRENRDETTTLTPVAKTSTIPQLPTVDDFYDTELPRPMDLFIDVDLR